jgi:hypothetical protein
VLTNRRDEFVETVTEKLLTYALGRAVQHYDQPAIRQSVREAASQDYRWSSLILAITRSTPFQMRQSSGVEIKPAAVAAKQPGGVSR